ncbi:MULTISPECIES: ABC transporter ATP-binding protein [unclassified Jeotgalibaca]|uniref:ABC transporter ATP-binding protein n=1 Tax=unclassified Jeotgalibaca TaxID=2621505 RepID=UPI003FD17AB6
MTLYITDLTGGYSAIPVLNNISFSVKAGELTGLIGLNGAGKSTTIKHIIGLMQPFAGTITINDMNIKQNPKAYRQSFAFVPETPVLYEELTFKEHIELTALAYGIEKEAAMAKAIRYIKAFRLEEKLDWFPAYFSKGMKQKVMLVCAFMVDAPVYVIDEPFLGLDPLGIYTFREIVKEKKAQGAAILMSTHVLSAAERDCDRFVVLHKGEVNQSGTLAEMQAALDMPGASLDDLYFRLTEEVIAL